MALIIRGQSTCCLCNRVLGAEDEIIGTTAFLTADHPFWQFSDAGMHRSCFLAWPMREQFVTTYNQHCIVERGHRMLDNGEIIQIPGHFSEAGERAMMAAVAEENRHRKSERHRADAAWSGRLRTCPKCGHEFRSVQDRGGCPMCRHVFYASKTDPS